MVLPLYRNWADDKKNTGKLKPDSVLPLYNDPKRASVILGKQNNVNRGLLWNRFFNAYTSNNFEELEQPAKLEFIATFAELDENSNNYESSSLRLVELVNSQEGDWRVFKNTWHFVTGMGNDHPTENGMTWHPTLGGPYLPGSSVKGLIRGWLEWNDPNDDRILSWFGTQNKSEVAKATGWFIFFDALPTESVELAADIMTPHYGEWYEQGHKIDNVNGEPNPKIVPADWHKPIPVAFLIIKKGTFLFGVAPRENLTPSEKDQAKNALPEVMKVLEDALLFGGAGAKTAVGYGHMQVDETEQQRIKQRFNHKLNEYRKIHEEKELKRRLLEQQAAETARRTEMDPIDLKIEDTIANWKEKGLQDWLKLYHSLFHKDYVGFWQDNEKPKVALRVYEMMSAIGKYDPELLSKDGQRSRDIQKLLE